MLITSSTTPMPPTSWLITPPSPKPTQKFKKLQSNNFQLRQQEQRYMQSEAQQPRFGQEQSEHHQHQHQQHLLGEYLPKQQRHQRCILLLIALIMLQQVELHACRQLATKRSSSSSMLDEQLISKNFKQQNSYLPTQRKRAELVQSSGGSGQPEEIFAFDDRMDKNYDEYPMIVPKRAALLLDRLMVALHNALERDREIEQQRIGELNANYKNDKGNDDGEADLDEVAPQIDHMYGDDPAVMMDYDFKDLNSINRATGETRRAKMGSGGSMGILGSTLVTGGAATRATSKSIGGSGGVDSVGGLGGGRINSGRLYWRCYFNAITCF